MRFRGEEIKRARLALGLTQEELGRLFGTSGNTVARWERDESKPDCVGMLRLALEALKLRKAAHCDDELKELIAETGARIDRLYKEAKQRAPKIREELAALEKSMI
jgi:transcriptional regulator with XRE-family HTH domain